MTQAPAMPDVSPMPQASARPVAETERIATIDILRGFALFGILTVNMYLFSNPFQNYLLPLDPNMPWYDRVGLWLVHFLTEGKFYTLFSLLFGLGFALQLQRARARGGKFWTVYMRRLLVLLGFGLVHAFFIWIGDILVLYALLGFVLLLFSKVKRPRTLLIWAGIFLAIPQVLSLALAALIEFGRTVPEAAVQIEAAFVEQEAMFAQEAERAREVYQTGSFLEITAQRARDLQTMWLGTLTMAPTVLGMFLIGAYFGKREIFADLAAHATLFRRLVIWGFLIGIPANLYYAFAIMQVSRTIFGWDLAFANLALAIGGVAQSLAYLGSITLLSRRDPWQRPLSALAPVGQMGLSNYLLQSIIATLIFYSYGLGFFGQVGAAAGWLIAIAIYATQIPLSHWWMRRFRYGPAEWLWRTLTYLRLQPMRR
ncbi:DUF418 domain-containing protein [Candidatus Chloroploca asiatica]|nr:DUF418 domain-containing protein [Candidatus Chloroploca asiatica]